MASANIAPSLQFQKIFVIGLPERTDRRDRIILQAFLSGVDIEFVDGVLGAEISDKAIPKVKGWKKPFDGALGCWRTHMNIMDRSVIAACLIFLSKLV